MGGDGSDHLRADGKEEHHMVTIRLILAVVLLFLVVGVIFSGILMISLTGHLILRELPKYWQMGLVASILVVGGGWMFRKQLFAKE